MSVSTAVPALRLVALTSASAAPSATAFQATLAAAVQALDRATGRVRTAQGAALCLAQRDRLAGVADDLDGVTQDLRPRLDKQGRCLMERQTGWAARLLARVRPQPAERTPESTPWVEALADAVMALTEASARMGTLSAGAGPEAADLARQVARRLRDHRDALLAEATRWAAHAA